VVDATQGMNWALEADAASERSIRARAAAHGEAALAASCRQRAQGAAALRTSGESAFWNLRGEVHELRRNQLEQEAEKEAGLERYARQQVT
jgi:hypothetical protein